jgi:hypothetical protein
MYRRGHHHSTIYHLQCAVTFLQHTSTSVDRRKPTRYTTGYSKPCTGTTCSGQLVPTGCGCSFQALPKLPSAYLVPHVKHSRADLSQTKATLIGRKAACSAQMQWPADTNACYIALQPLSSAQSATVRTLPRVSNMP